MTCQQSAGSNRLTQQFAAITSITAIGHSMTRAFGWTSCFHLCARLAHSSSEQRALRALLSTGQLQDMDAMLFVVISAAMLFVAISAHGDKPCKEYFFGDGVAKEPKLLLLFTPLSLRTWNTGSSVISSQ